MHAPSQLVAREVEVLQVVAVANRVGYGPFQHVVEEIEHSEMSEEAQRGVQRPLELVVVKLQLDHSRLRMMARHVR